MTCRPMMNYWVWIDHRAHRFHRRVHHCLIPSERKRRTIKLNESETETTVQEDL